MLDIQKISFRVRRKAYLSVEVCYGGGHVKAEGKGVWSRSVDKNEKGWSKGRDALKVDVYINDISLNDVRRGVSRIGRVYLRSIVETVNVTSIVTLSGLTRNTYKSLLSAFSTRFCASSVFIDRMALPTYLKTFTKSHVRAVGG